MGTYLDPCHLFLAPFLRLLFLCVVWSKLTPRSLAQQGSPEPSPMRLLIGRFSRSVNQNRMHVRDIKSCMHGTYGSRHASRLPGDGIESTQMYTAMIHNSTLRNQFAGHVCMYPPDVECNLPHPSLPRAMPSIYDTRHSTMPPILLSTHSLASRMPRSVVKNMHSPGVARPLM